MHFGISMTAARSTLLFPSMRICSRGRRNIRLFWHKVYLEQAQDNALPPVAEKILFHIFLKKAGLRRVLWNNREVRIYLKLVFIALMKDQARHLEVLGAPSLKKTRICADL